MRKTFYSLGAVAEAMSACNRRYLAYISQWRDQTRERHALCQITASVRDEKERSVRGVNFFRARPNEVHDAIVRLEKAGKLQVVVTQNIDGLHSLAGTSPERLVELHGTNSMVECQRCHWRGDPQPYFDFSRAAHTAALRLRGIPQAGHDQLRTKPRT
jgi:NAD-dependent deacetylase